MSKTISETVYDAMVACSGEGDETDAQGKIWKTVYLDNCLQRLGLTRHQVAGALGALDQAGKYKSLDDGFFGRVLMPNA